MGPTRVNRKLPNECEEQIKGYEKVAQNTEIFSTKYGNNISEVGSPDVFFGHSDSMLVSHPTQEMDLCAKQLAVARL